MKTFSVADQILELEGNNYNLPLYLKPVLQFKHTAEILIIGPAPGIRAHKTGTPWDDPSGNKLRSWMNVTREEFYDKNRVALISMNFWYPGINKYGNDKPPNIKDAELWHRPLLKLLPNVKLTLLIGHQAQRYYLKEMAKSTLTETVTAWKEYLPNIIVLPHSSWHNTNWLKNNKWFERELLIELRRKVKQILTRNEI